MDYYQDFTLLNHQHEIQKPYLHPNLVQNEFPPTQDAIHINNLVSYLPANYDIDIDVTCKFEDIPTIEHIDQYSSHSPEKNDADNFDDEYERMWRDQKWFSKPLFPSKRGRKRKPSINDRETASNNLSCRKYRHKKSDELKNSELRRIRSLIASEKIELEQLLEKHSNQAVLSEFLNFFM